MASELPAVPRTADELAAVDAAQWQAVLEGDPRRALSWVDAAARLGYAQAQAVLGQWLLEGRPSAGIERDPEQALSQFLLAAQQGDAMGMNMAGRCHEQGWGTPVDANKAAHWYRQAIRCDLPAARYNLANLLASGHGVARDHRAAFELYREATEQGYAKAFAKLGRYFEDGLVVAQDRAKAFDCYRRGAEGGDFRGQFCYAGVLAGLGRQTEALAWLEKVPETATPRYLREAGALLQQSEHPRVRALGEQMLERATG